MSSFFIPIAIGIKISNSQYVFRSFRDHINDLVLMYPH